MAARELCEHDWDSFDEQQGVYRNSVCILCGAWRHQDFVNDTERIDPPLEDMPDDENEDFDWSAYRDATGYGI